MATINILDHQTIDKIAAGEVVERPASVVKELVENAIDAGADAITVEIKDGGTSLIRVTDNGGGIEKSQVRNAFLRHATSKITSADDLTDLVSLGFRGEALASIAAVSMVELITKISEELTGIRYVIEGGLEKEQEEIGAPEGTTILVRNLFFNTPPRKKFLKQPQTEGSYVADLMEHLALSDPKISFKFILNGQTRFYTTGNNELREIIYRIYGKDMASELLPFSWQGDGMTVSGFLGKPVINRANRNYEIFYINGRYIRSSLISKAIEEGYREYLMQHKFPFCVLHFQIDTKRIDVNVHPTKMEVRIADGPVFYEAVKEAIHDTLRQQEMIPEVSLTERKEQKKARSEELCAGRQNAGLSMPEPFEKKRIAEMPQRAASDAISRIYENHQQSMVRSPDLYHAGNVPAGHRPAGDPAPEIASVSRPEQTVTLPEQSLQPVQMEMFTDKILSEPARKHFELIGQIFDTYWLISYEDRLLIIDQHAAHEKIKYERFMKQFREQAIVSQTMNPPLVVTLTGKEQECYSRHAEDFEALGFVIEEFGGSEYAIRGVPMDLYGYEEKTFFQELLDQLAAESASGTPESIRTRIATMACKAAVKGNMRLCRQEAEQLIDELLTLDNPYHCPHGRPTIISMSKYELEKKFKRIVS
ncbi:MAG: DNA mismatch repair endonuclease MutL [Lachnospiraceae bacterium]|nr:DNA mismatch repair endonuclease MutL [Lachnospiraceae bacterium]